MKLGEDAFEYYVGLGAARNYQAVADHFGVSKRCVAKRAADEGWQGRLAKLVADARSSGDAKAAEVMESMRTQHVQGLNALQGALREVVTPERFKALVASVLTEAIKKGDIAAARLLFERVLGKARSEPILATALDLPDGLETTKDVTRAANAILQAVADGSLSPEDAQKAAAVVEAARRAVETGELEQRITELEDRAKEKTR